MYVVAATHQNLEQLVTKGDFREDLFHRLNVIRIQIPALRERKQDIEKLTLHFLALAAEELGVDVKTSILIRLRHLTVWTGRATFVS